MKVCVVGAGALGIFYGTMLARSGVDVRFFTRTLSAEATRFGFFVSREGEPITLYPVNEYTNAADVGACDLVVVLAKATANANLVVSLAPMMRGGAHLLTLQNGLGNVERFADAFGKTRVFGGVCFAAATREAPNRVNVAFAGSVRLADPLGAPRPELGAITAAFCRAGVPCKTTPSLDEILWRKLVWNIPFSGLCLAHNATTDTVMADASARAEAAALMEETRATAAACGVAIPESFLKTQMDATDKLGAYAPSALVDLRAGRPFEFDAIFGEPLRRARAVGVAVPHLEALCGHLRALCR